MKNGKRDDPGSRHDKGISTNLVKELEEKELSEEDLDHVAGGFDFKVKTISFIGTGTSYRTINSKEEEE